MNIQNELSNGLYLSISMLDEFPVVLCVGSDKVVGDALAPICGGLLKKMMPPCFVYGTLQSPVNANNLVAAVKFIKRMHPRHKILVVDASVGLPSDIGKIKFIRGGIAPGKAVGREFEKVGDFAIAGIVASKNSEKNTLSPVRLFDAYNMAEEIAREIYACARSFVKSPTKKTLPKHQSLAGIYM